MQQSRIERDAAPRIGFVSLGCPKALVDSEQILTQLRAEGYTIAPSYAGADLVVVNTCGFIDAAVEESLDAIGEALAENGKVVVTGCLGAKDHGDFVRNAHPKVLAVTGPHATSEVMSAVHAHVPKPHDPFVDLVPPQGIKLTPSHYAYLKISEGCNHRCTFCIIPAMRGDLVSRSIGEVLLEAERLFKAGVKELLVVSQDTSAYGVDVKYLTGFWRGRPLKTRMTELARELAALARAYRAWVRLHYVYPYPHVDDLIPLMADGRCCHTRRAVPAREPEDPEGDEASRSGSEDAAAHPRMAQRGSGAHDPLNVHRRLPGETEQDFQMSTGRGSGSRPRGLLPLRARAHAAANALPNAVPEEVRGALAPLHGGTAEDRARAASAWAPRSTIVDERDGDQGSAVDGRRARDRRARVLPGGKGTKKLQPGSVISASPRPTSTTWAEPT